VRLQGGRCGRAAYEECSYDHIRGRYAGYRGEDSEAEGAYTSFKVEALTSSFSKIYAYTLEHG
jgi:hypothetical protein